jgi:hypothetical protein
VCRYTSGVASDGSTLVPTGSGGVTVLTASWKGVESAPILVTVAAPTEPLPITKITQTTVGLLYKLNSVYCRFNP